MAENRNIDKWDLQQTFPPIAETKCPYCSSDEIFDPHTLKDKFLRFLVFLFASARWPFPSKRRNAAVYRRRKCAKCGFEYSVERSEPVLIVIGLAIVLPILVWATIMLCWPTSS